MTPRKLLVSLVVSAVLFGGTGYLIGRPKGRGGTGFWLGWLLSVIGLVIIAVLPENREALVRREQERQRIQRDAAARNAADVREDGARPARRLMAGHRTLARAGTGVPRQRLPEPS